MHFSDHFAAGAVSHLCRSCAERRRDRAQYCRAGEPVADGIVLARHGAGVALVEPLLVTSMGLPGIVIRPLKPRIDIKTLLIRHKTAPQSKIMNEFIGHLGKVIAAEPSQ